MTDNCTKTETQHGSRGNFYRLKTHVY